MLVAAKMKMVGSPSGAHSRDPVLSPPYELRACFSDRRVMQRIHVNLRAIGDRKSARASVERKEEVSAGEKDDLGALIAAQRVGWAKRPGANASGGVPTIIRIRNNDGGHGARA